MTIATNNPGVSVEFENTMSKKLFLATGFYTEGQGDYIIDDSQNGVVIVSPSVCMAGPTHITLETSLRTRGYHTTHRDRSVLATIPLSTGYNEYLVFEPQNTVYHINENDRGALTNLRVQFRRDDTDELISTFNGVPWTLTLGIRGIEEE